MTDDYLITDCAEPDSVKIPSFGTATKSIEHATEVSLVKGQRIYVKLEPSLDSVGLGVLDKDWPKTESAPLYEVRIDNQDEQQRFWKVVKAREGLAREILGDLGASTSKLDDLFDAVSSHEAALAATLNRITMLSNWDAIVDAYVAVIDDIAFAKSLSRRGAWDFSTTVLGLEMLGIADNCGGSVSSMQAYISSGTGDSWGLPGCPSSNPAATRTIGGNSALGGNLGGCLDSMFAEAIDDCSGSPVADGSPDEELGEANCDCECTCSDTASPAATRESETHDDATIRAAEAERAENRARTHESLAVLTGVSSGALIGAAAVTVAAAPFVAGVLGVAAVGMFAVSVSNIYMAEVERDRATNLRFNLFSPGPDCVGVTAGASSGSLGVPVAGVPGLVRWADGREAMTTCACAASAGMDSAGIGDFTNSMAHACDPAGKSEFTDLACLIAPVAATGELLSDCDSTLDGLLSAVDGGSAPTKIATLDAVCAFMTCPQGTASRDPATNDCHCPGGAGLPEHQPWADFRSWLDDLCLDPRIT